MGCTCPSCQHFGMLQPETTPLRHPFAFFRCQAATLVAKVKFSRFDRSYWGRKNLGVFLVWFCPQTFCHPSGPKGRMGAWREGTWAEARDPRRSGLPRDFSWTGPPRLFFSFSSFFFILISEVFLSRPPAMSWPYAVSTSNSLWSVSLITKDWILSTCSRVRLASQGPCLALAAMWR
uniref:Uncharacterized protein n=1 Tax=Myotis myotis TaxID=51298 RepID=A0A7J7VYT1_MYOMY|nr:hypothetical protein mMyoMyo1_012355 [Myotis myotis]